MFQNILKTSLRNLWRNRGFAFINIFGLGLGTAVCMLILFYVSHELSFDRFHTKADRTYSALMKLKMGERDLQLNLFTPDFAERVKAANPDVTESLRFATNIREEPVVKSEEGRQFIEKRFYFADPSIFRIFSFRFLSGDPRTALDAPDAVAISAPAAVKYFGDADPLGKTLLYNKKDLLRVTAVFEKMPSNSSLQFDFIAALPVFERRFREENPDRNFDAAPNFQTWFVLAPGASKSAVEASIPTALPQNDDPIMGDAKYALSPLLEMHLGNNWGDFSNQKYIGVFLLAAGLVLFLALFNYMNLTTARLSVRTREVGVRKVLGAGRSQIGWQFYGESILVGAAGFALGFAFFSAARPAFLNLLDLKIDEQFLYGSLFIGVLGGLFLLSALIAGSYPSLLVSRFSPVRILKGGALGGDKEGSGVRRALMVFQFAVSTALVAGSLIVREQVQHMQNHDIGMHREQVMVVPVTKNIGAHFPAFRSALQEQAGVEKVSLASFAFFQGGWDVWFVQTPDTKEDVGISALRVDRHFFETLDIQWKIPPANPSELASKKQLLLNESGIAALKITDNPIGKRIESGNGPQEIVGITRDFNFVGLQSKIEGMLIAVVPDTTALADQGGQLYVRLDPKSNIREKVAMIEGFYKKFEKEVPFDYYFLDEAFNNQYRAERRMGIIFGGFSGVALLLAAMGLLGLSAFMTERRTKEIGIRKVLGASAASVVGLLAGDFLKLVIIAVALASPIAWLWMRKWLQDFAYRIELQWWMFAAAGAVAVLVAAATVGLQSLRAALTNPATSLRSE